MLYKKDANVHMNKTFSYSQGSGRNQIDRKLFSTYSVVIKRIDNENAELYYRNSTTSYCDPPMNVLVTDIVTNISIPCLVFQMIFIIFQVDNTMKLLLDIMSGSQINHSIPYTLKIFHIYHK